MASPPEGVDISGPEYAEFREAMKQFTGHLVCLCFFSHRLDLGKDLTRETKACFCSGFVLEVGDKWYWTTAGHILEDIATQMRDPDAVVKDFRLLDHFGTGETDKNYIPFDYERAWRHYRYDKVEGLDYGVVELREHDRRLIQANRVTPVTVREWEGLEPLDFNSHFMVGFPSDSVESGARLIPEGAVISGRAAPSAIYLELCEPEVAARYATPSPRLVYRIGSNWPEGDIDGMSGGPVFGYAEKGNGMSEFRVLGIQSSWWKSERISFACPLHVAGPRIVEAIQARSG